MSDSWCSDVEQGAVLLTINQRLSRHYMRQYSDKQLSDDRAWWETPQILPLSAWLKQQHASAVASGASDKTMLADIAAERAWQQVVSKDEKASVLLDTDLAANNAQKAWRIANAWQLEGSVESDSMASDDQRAFGSWRNSYTKHCKRNNLIDSSTIADHVAEVISNSNEAIDSNSDAQLGLPETILLAGFLSIPSQLQALLDVLKNRGVKIRHVELTQQATLQRLVHPDDDGAFEIIARQIRQLIEQNPNQHVGVVVHDLQQRRAQVLRAFDKVFFPALNPVEINTVGRPYDLSIGLPLTEQSLVRTALLFLKLQTSGLNDTEFSTLLLSPYLPGTASDISSRQRIDRSCRDKRVRHVSFFDFIKHLGAKDTLVKSLQKVSKRKWKKEDGAAVWAEHFGAALRDLGWPGKAIGSEEYQTVEAWKACLDDFQILDDGESISAKRALHLLNRLCKSRVFQLETAATPVQIMGRLESHGLSFDKLWVTGLDSDQWPPVSVPTSFIPIQQQIAVGVPDAAPALRLAHAEAELALWKRSTTELLVCHAKTRDGIELSPATIVDDVPELAGESIELDQVDTAALIQSSAQLHQVDDTHGPEVVGGSKVKGGTRLLENQARCPFKAFALHRLGIKKLEEAGIGLDPRQHGTLFHHCMELFWGRVKTHAALIALSPEELDETYQSVIAESMQEHEVDEKLKSLQSRYLHRLMSEWISVVEIRRQPFKVTELEKSLDLDFEGMEISVTVDRTDVLESGQTVVIDYKTGQHNAIGTWGEPRIENPQLPLYVGTDKAVEGVCFAQVYPNQCKLIGTTSEDNIVGSLKAPENHRSLQNKLENWDDARAHWEASLNSLALEIREGVASITPVKKACDFCELSSLCRIDKSLNDLDEENEADTSGVQA